MAARIGRHLKITWDGTLIAAVKTKSMKVAGSAVDITSDDDLGYRTLLAESGMYSVDLSVEGVWKSTQLLADVMADTVLKDVEIQSYDASEVLEWTIAGSFRMNGIEAAGDTSENVKFSAEIQSSGAFTYVEA